MTAHILSQRKPSLVTVTIAVASMVLTLLPSKVRAEDDSSGDRLKRLEEAVAALQQENKSLKQQVNSLQEKVSASSRTAAAPAEHRSTVVSTTPTATPLATANGDREYKSTAELYDVVISPRDKSPLTLQIADLSFTLFGFVDLTSVTRSVQNGGDIGTSFASFPYSNTPAAQLSETRLSAKNSRFGLRMDTKLSDIGITGYVETDFLGNQPSNINVVSNSDTLRMRVYFVDLNKGPWEFLAGQDWSMLTPNRKGISPFPNDIFFSQTVDVNYQLGLVWERTPQLRLLYHASDSLTFGLSAENPDQYVGPSVTLPPGFNAGQVDNGSNGTATPNFMPDIVGKVAYDTKFGNLPFHADLAGIYRQYTINTFVSGTGLNEDSSASGYGGLINLNLNVLPKLMLIGQFYASDGAGREISTGVAPDFVISAPDASGVYHIDTVKSYAGITGLEWDVLKNAKLWAYYGQTYMDSEFSRLTNGTYVGYGFPGSSNSNNKRIEEYTIGWTQTLWKSQRYGDLKLMLQYSYLTRDPWFVAPNTPSDASMHMGYLNIRYDLP